MTWTQVYNPTREPVPLGGLVAAIPVVVLLGSLAFFHVKAHVAALLGLAAALAGGPAASTACRPRMAVAAAFNGALFGLLPIGWIVLNAIFVYDITVSTGKFEIVKETIAGLASDRRIQILLIGFSFGAFIEGASGFGTPVAICAAMLIGLGFKPLAAAGLALIGNTAPGRLRRPRDAGDHPGQGHRPPGEAPQRDGRAASFPSSRWSFPSGWCGRWPDSPGWSRSGRPAWSPGCSSPCPSSSSSNYVGPALVDIVSAGVQHPGDLRAAQVLAAEEDLALRRRARCVKQLSAAVPAPRPGRPGCRGSFSRSPSSSGAPTR